MNDLAGKTILVTGAAQGLGEAMVERLVDDGATVIGADLRVPDSSRASTFLTLDVGREQSWIETVAAVTDAHGPLHGLVNNAGVMSSAPVHEMEVEEWDRVMRVNVTGVLLGMKHVVPGMRALGRGSIVNVASIWGLVGAPDAAAYQASKGAVFALSRSAALTYAPEGIRVNSVHPGFTDTEMIRAQGPEVLAHAIAMHPVGRIARPSEIADAVAFLLSDRSTFITAAPLLVDGGYSAR